MVNTEQLRNLVNPRPGFHFVFEVYWIGGHDKEKKRLVRLLQGEKAIKAMEIAFEASGGNVRKAISLIEAELKRGV